MSLVLVDPCVDPTWQQLVDDYDSDVFHSPSWLRVLAKTYGFEVAAYVLLDEDKRPLAGLPFCRITDFKNTRIAALPFSDYCDPLVRTLDQWKELAVPLREESVAISMRCLHNEVPLGDTAFPVVNRTKWHCINLDRSLDEIWQQFPGSVRRAVRKAKAQDVIIRPAQTLEDLKQFFNLHLHVRKYKYNLLAQPYRFFESIWEEFMCQNQGVIFLAEYKGKVVASTFFLEWSNTFYYKFNASLSKSLSVRPNDLLIWTGMKYAKEKGFKQWDFGLSDWDQEGLVRYKRKFATEEKTIHFLRYTPPALESPPRLAEIGQLLPQLTTLYTDGSVPDHITAQAGDLLYRYFC